MRTLTPNIQLISAVNPRFPFLPCCNSLLIEDDVTALVDTGTGGALVSLAESGRVEQVVHTHIHPDHINYDYLFPDSTMWVPAYAADGYTSLDAFLAYQGGLPLGRSYATFCATEQGYRPAQDSRTYRDGDVLEFGCTRLRAIHAPGHSVDHMLLYAEAEGVLFSTDIDLTPFGPWYGNPGSDIDQSLAAIELVRRLQPRLLVSSHAADPVNGADLPPLLDRYAAAVAKRDDRILSLLREPATLEQVQAGRPIYRTYPDPEPLVRLFDRNMIRMHLERLAARGLVRREGDLYRAV